MRHIYFLRHAKSSWDDGALDDFERPLSGRGRKAARAMGKFLAKQNIRPNLVLCSAAKRTRSTYEIIEPRLEGVPVSIERDLYAAAKGNLLDRLRKLDDHLASVMLIGHNPGLERLAAFLAGPHGEPHALEHLAEKFPTGTLAIIETDTPRWAQLDAGTCRLTALIRPRDLDESA
jgi:phosphohistidine phosphatase